MLINKFIYDLTGRPEPTREELSEELNRLLFVQGAEEPNYLVPTEDQLSQLDSDVISQWVRRRFEPALILVILHLEENYQRAKSELAKKDQTLLDRLFRAQYVKRHAMQRIKEMCFDDVENLKLPQVVTKLKKTLTFLSKHLEQTSPNYKTLKNTDAYTSADITLYKYLKRIVVGRYKDSGLKSHVRLCDSLREFMSRYATKNIHVINVSSGDPIESPEESSLLSDITKPAIFALGVIIFYLWRTS